MILLHSFTPALFLYGHGYEPVSIERADDGTLTIAFSDEAKPVWQHYIAVRRRLNDLIETAQA